MLCSGGIGAGTALLQTLLPSSCVSLPAWRLAPCSEAFRLLPMHQNRYELGKTLPDLIYQLTAPKRKGQPFCHFSPQLCTTAQPAHMCLKPAWTWRLAPTRAQSSDPVQALRKACWHRRLRLPGSPPYPFPILLLPLHLLQTYCGSVEQPGSGGQATTFNFCFPVLPPAAGKCQIDSPVDPSRYLASFDIISNQGIPKLPLIHCKNPFI